MSDNTCLWLVKTDIVCKRHWCNGHWCYFDLLLHQWQSVIPVTSCFNSSVWFAVSLRIFLINFSHALLFRRHLTTTAPVMFFFACSQHAIEQCRKTKMYRLRRDSSPRRRAAYLQQKKAKYKDNLAKGRRRNVATMNDRMKRMASPLTEL